MAPLAIRVWGVSWVGFGIFALVLSLIPYTRGERWAWWTLGLLPVLWLIDFMLVPSADYNLVFAVIGTLGLILPYRRFFAA